MVPLSHEIYFQFPKDMLVIFHIYPRYRTRKCWIVGFDFIPGDVPHYLSTCILVMSKMLVRCRYGHANVVNLENLIDTNEISEKF